MFPGRIIVDRYRVLRVLGRGGMGVVSEVEEIATAKHFAIKFLRDDVESDIQPSARFMREAKLATRLKSPHTCRVSEIGEWELGPFVVMELLQGRSLAAILEDKVAVTWQQAVRIACEMCRALGEAHRLQIVHRDVKPGNVFIARTADGNAVTKVLDFGVAKIPTSVVTASGERSLTDAAVMIGTPSYVAPEQLMNSKLVDARADVWAVGVLMYELFAGRLPFISPLVPKLLVMIAREAHQPLSTVAPSVPEPLAQVVHRCLNKDPLQRYDDAGALAQTLLPWLDSTPDLLCPLLALPSKRVSISPTVPPSCEVTQVTPPGRNVRDSLGPHTAANLDADRRRRRSRMRCIAAGTTIGAVAAALYIVIGAGTEATSVASRDATPPAASDSSASANALHHFLVLVDPTEAEVSLDNVVVPGNPARLAFRDDGKDHLLTITAPGHATETRRVRFNVDQRLSLALRPLATLSAPPEPTSERPAIRRAAARPSTTRATTSSKTRRIDTDNPF